jgi:imidazolonepropionase-like amidohydrolase
VNTVIRNGRILDATKGTVGSEQDILVEDGLIREISDSPISASSAHSLDAGGRVVMPGLIDLHVHVAAPITNRVELRGMSNSVVAFDAFAELGRMLRRGFTTVRDAAGADKGLADLVRTGAINGPRLFVSGRSLSQTAGHGDFGGVSAHMDCGTCAVHRPLGAASRIADGVDAVRIAVRDELRAGADQIKVMASGGVSSPSDPLMATQFSFEELQAAVQEAEAWGTYVMAHADSPAAITKAVTAGVRTIEHANFADAAVASLMREHGAFAVPTLVAYEGLVLRGRDLGMSIGQISELEAVLAAGMSSLEILHAAGVQVGFGTDLLGPLRQLQSREFELRAEVLPASVVLASATTVAAEVLGQSGHLGVIAPGAAADLLIVDGDPTIDVRVLGNDGADLALIMAAGTLVKNNLEA